MSDWKEKEFIDSSQHTLTDDEEADSPSQYLKEMMSHSDKKSEDGKIVKEMMRRKIWKRRKRREKKWMQEILR